MRKAKKGFVRLFAPEIFALVILIGIFRYVDGCLTASLLGEDGTSEETERAKAPTTRRALDETDEIDYQREKARKNLQMMFGTTGRSASKELRSNTPPQFMLELYNTIADPSGATRGRNPYNAKIVRSFVERGTSLPHLYLFEISGIESNESVIAAELHLFRKRSALRVVDPTILKSPYYLIRVYQVLEGQSMDEPDAHRLLNVHYVGAHASGWQVFNVKQAVLAWIAGAPNLGLMVTASNIFGDVALIEFSRRDDYHRGKQPILVLFDDDGKDDRDTDDKVYEVPHYNRQNDDEDDEIFDNDANNDPSMNEANGETNDEVSNEANDETNNEANNEANNKKEQDKIYSEALHDYDSGSTVDRPKREQAIEEPMKTVAVNGNRELNKEIDYGTQLGADLKPGQTEYLQRNKKIGRKQNFERDRNLLGNSSSSESDTRPIGEARTKENNKNPASQSESLRRNIRSANTGSSRRTTRKLYNIVNFVPQTKETMQQVLRSMDIYERAMMRQQIEDKKSDKIGPSDAKRKPSKSKRKIVYSYTSRREKRFPREATGVIETSRINADSRKTNDTGCTIREFYVDFEEMGLSSFIIAPKRYSAFQCQGRCDAFPADDRRTTNHATVQEIVYRMGLRRDVHPPCCVPTELRSISVLFFDDEENVVLKVYEDMIADRCGCR